MSYASGTTVDPTKTRADIERVLLKAKCTHVGLMTEPDAATVYFRRDGWAVQMRLKLPTIEDVPATGRRRTPAARQAWVVQKTRERWRQLLLVLKAKLTAVDEGVETFEESFLAHLILGNVHVGQNLLPSVRRAKETGTSLLLPSGS